jgi:hypothetical protein
MIVSMKQEKTNFDLQYRFQSGERTLCVAAAPFERGNLTTTLRFSDGTEQQLYFNPADTRWGGGLHDRLSFKILENGEKIGFLVGATQKTGRLFGGYPYYQVDYREKAYEAYAVGLGKDGIFLCLYRDGRVLSVTEKDLIVHNYQDTYTLYLDREEDFPLTALAVLYYDLTCYGDLMELSVRSVKKYSLHTVQKELLAKYDPDFIPRIRKRDGMNQD